LFFLCFFLWTEQKNENLMTTKRNIEEEYKHLKALVQPQTDTMEDLAGGKTEAVAYIWAV